MSDLIDRRYAIRIVDSIDTWQSGWRGDAIESLKALPSAQPERCEDCKNFSKTRLLIPQPEIIRCKDCKYRGGLSGFYCDIVGKAVGVDSFCSWAERRTDE